MEEPISGGLEDKPSSTTPSRERAGVIRLVEELCRNIEVYASSGDVGPLAYEEWLLSEALNDEDLRTARQTLEARAFEDKLLAALREATSCCEAKITKILKSEGGLLKRSELSLMFRGYQYSTLGTRALALVRVRNSRTQSIGLMCNRFCGRGKLLDAFVMMLLVCAPHHRHHQQAAEDQNNHLMTCSLTPCVVIDVVGILSHLFLAHRRVPLALALFFEIWRFLK